MTSSLTAHATGKTYRHFQAKLLRKSLRKRLVRTSLLISNLAILAGIVGFVALTQHTGSAKASARAVTNAPITNPLDQLSSADIALTVARMNSLPESTAINSQAISQSVELTQAPTTGNVVAKPQVIATALKSKADIKSYITQTGDTISNLATKFGVTSDSIRWSNGLGSSDAITVNQKINIPPVNGIVYTVVAGDTIDSLASKYKASTDKIVAFNDAEISGLQPGERIIIPDGMIAPPVVATRVFAVSSIGASSNLNTATAFPWGGNSALYGSNGYDYGYCTWYVATRVAVPSNWGNAYTWDELAPRSGWRVSDVPVVGAVAQSHNISSLGHVAYVEAVSADGTMIKYSDMNNLAGFGRVGFSDWVRSTTFQHYIYR